MFCFSGITTGKESAPAKEVPVAYDDLAFRFLDALLTVLIDFSPSYVLVVAEEFGGILI